LTRFTATIAAVTLLLNGCMQSSPQSQQPIEEYIRELAQNNTTPMSIYLYYPKSVDLDLFVTDPFDEATYYGNSPTSHGSRLVKDSICASTDEHAIEVIEFPNPSIGRYRIGLDFPESCDEQVKEVPYLIVVNRNGIQRNIRGTIKFQHYLLVVDEFTHAADK